MVKLGHEDLNASKEVEVQKWRLTNMDVKSISTTRRAFKEMLLL